MTLQHRSVRHRRLLFGTTLALAACSSSPKSSPQHAARAGNEECKKALSVPKLISPPPVGEVRSHLTVELRAPASWLRQMIAARVPVQLAQGERDIGLPGRIRFALKRQAISISLDDADRLIVSTPVDGKISVCKPIAGFCPVYGRCSPRLQAIVAVPLRLTETLELERSAVSIPIAKGCTIAGFSADSELRGRANQEAIHIKREVDTHLPQLRQPIATVWEASQTPVDLGLFGCVSVVPRTISQRRVQLDGGTLSTAFSVEGSLSLDRECPAMAAQPGALPPLGYLEQLPPTHLQLPLAIPWSVVERELAATLRSSPTSQRVERLRARGAMVEGKARVVLEVYLPSSCAPFWVSGRPILDTETSTVRLTNVRPIRAVDSDAPTSDEKAVLLALTKDATVALPFNANGSSEALEGLANSWLVRQVPDAIATRVTLQPTSGRVLLDAVGLQVVLVVAGQALVEPAHP